MPHLSCSVPTCSSNCQGRCCRPEISVHGPAACHQEETDCLSFEAKKYLPTNCLHEYDNPNACPLVHCDAVNCVYNENRLCAADTVEIYGKGAEAVQTTACNTFRCK